MKWIQWTIFSGLLAMTSAARASDYYLSPGGSDSGDGGAAAPWKTFSHAISKLVPGDSLILVDGTYTTAGAGNFNVNCNTGPGKSGTKSAPITLRAQNERRAHIHTDGTMTPIRLTECQWYVVSGLHISGTQNSNVTEGNVGVGVTSSSNIVVKRNLIHDMNHYWNSGGVTVWKSQDVLVEENEAYGANRNVIYALSSQRITFRRNYCWAGPRVEPQGTGGAQGPQDCMIMYSSTDGIYENNVSRHADAGFGNTGQRNKYLGNIAINCNNGLVVGEHPAEYMPVIDNLYENNLAIHIPGEREMSNGLLSRSDMGLIVRNLSVFGVTSNGVGADNPYDPRRGPGACGSYPGTDPSGNPLPCKTEQSPEITVQNTIVLDSNGGYYVGDASEFAKRVFEYSGGWNNKNGTWRTGTETRDPATTPPPGVAAASDLGSCRAYIPASSTLRSRGKNGADIGANILYAYQDGTLTSKPLWDPKTGQFPCGAVVQGVNDPSIPHACVNIHKVVGVNSAGCPLPAGYGKLPAGDGSGGRDGSSVGEGGSGSGADLGPPGAVMDSGGARLSGGGSCNCNIAAEGEAGVVPGLGLLLLVVVVVGPALLLRRR